jgi:hypothetical protein
VPPAWLVAMVWTEFELPNWVCAVACAWPVEPITVDCD